MRSLIALVLVSMIFAMPVRADDDVMIRTTQKLSEQQKAELSAQAAKMAAENAAGGVAAPTRTVENVKQWVDIGTAIGSGLAASAKELGVAANDFATTPVGKFTVFMIAWHFIGSTILHTFFAILWLAITVSIFTWMYRRAAYVKTIEFFEKGQGPRGIRKQVVYTPKSIGENLGAIMTISSGVATLIFVVMLFNL